MRSRLGMIFSIPPTLATFLVAAMIGAGTWAMTRVDEPEDDDRRFEPVASQLERTIPPFRVENVTFETALDILRQHAGLNFRCTPKAADFIATLGPTLSTGLRNAKASKILRTFLESSVGDGSSQLIYTTDEHGVLIMLNEELLDIVEEETFWVGEIFEQVDPTISGSEIMEQMENLITNTIAVGAWDHPNVQLSSDAENALLHVRHSPETIRQISSLVKRMTEHRQFTPPLHIRAGMPW